MEKQCGKMVDNGPMMQFEVQYQFFLLFNQTCRYVSSLIDSIVSCNMKVPYDSVQRVTELNNSLATFLKYSKTNNANSSITLKHNRSTSILNKKQITGESVPHNLLTSQDTKMKGHGVILQNNVPVPLKTDWNDMVAESTTANSLLETSCKTADKHPMPKAVSPKTKKPKCSPSQNQHQIPIIKAQELKKSGMNSENGLYSREVNGNVNQIELINQVTEPFQALIKKILNGTILSIKKDVYCRLCDIFCAEGWEAHLKHRSHCQSYQSNKKYDLTMFACIICNLVIYGKRDLILKYLYFHFYKLHQDQETADWMNSYYEIQVNSTDSYSNIETILTDERFTRQETLGGNNGPVIKIQETAPSANPQRKKRKIKKKTSSCKEDLSSPASSSNADTDLTTNNSAQNTLHIEFDNLLKRMLDDWEKKALLTESGFCDICKIGCSSYFSWFDHMEEHTNDKNPEWSELKCIHCPLRIYGTNHGKYFSSPTHELIDKIVRK